MGVAQVKDDNAAKGVPERPAGMCALVKRRYGLIITRKEKSRNRNNPALWFRGSM